MITKFWPNYQKINSNIFIVPLLIYLLIFHRQWPYHGIPQLFYDAYWWFIYSLLTNLYIFVYIVDIFYVNGHALLILIAILYQVLKYRLSLRSIDEDFGGYVAVGYLLILHLFIIKVIILFFFQINLFFQYAGVINDS